MTELPERKVLKQILEKLKTKTMSSKSNVSKRAMETYGSLEEINKRFEEIIKGIPESQGEAKMVIEQVKILFRVISIGFGILISQYEDALADMSLYVGSLENYSQELDKTLSGIFEQATKNAEEQIKKQNELMPKKDASYIK